MPEGARASEIVGAGDLVFYRIRNEAYFVTDGTHTCALDLQWGYPRRAQREGSRVLIELIDSAVGHEDGCTNEDDTHRVTVIDFEQGELMTLPTGRFFDSECTDAPPSRTGRASRGPTQVRLSEDTLTVARARRDAPGAPTHWLLGQTLTLRDGVYTLPRED